MKRDSLGLCLLRDFMARRTPSVVIPAQAGIQIPFLASGFRLALAIASLAGMTLEAMH
jgi:hypothetical protein